MAGIFESDERDIFLETNQILPNVEIGILSYIYDSSTDKTIMKNIIKSLNSEFIDSGFEKMSERPLAMMTHGCLIFLAVTTANFQNFYNIITSKDGPPRLNSDA